MANRAEQVIACSAYMRDHIADIYAIEEERIAVIPNGIDPADLQPWDEEQMRELRARFAAPDEKLVLLVGRLVYEKGFQVALEALPQRDRGARGRALPGRRLGDPRGGAARPGDRARARRARHLPGLDRRRRAAHALPDRRPDGRALDLRAVRARRARGDGVRLPVPGRRHRRPARGRPARGGRAALPLARPGVARVGGGARAGRRRAGPAAGGRGLRARAQLRLGRRGGADGGRLRGQLLATARPGRASAG